ncbi:MAG: tRNA (adenosine(37)-N6)-threonylcarbamoyltransferase complex transferase subunit TsaD, partial [Chitinophagales bacterium]
AKSLALALQVPLIGVHHMQAHVMAHFIEEPRPSFPFLCLTVSGGHTQIVLVKNYLQMEVVGESVDDAAGEAFDKTAKLLKLPYPGGPLIDKYALQGDPLAFKFPEPNVPNLDFSFSGLKTSILYFLRDQLKHDPFFIEKRLTDICASVQYRIVTILLNKLERAAHTYNIREIAIAGGVSANSGLRKELKKYGAKNNWNLFIPAFEYCTDNAAMIAIAGYYKFLEGDFTALDTAPAAGLNWR